MNPAPPKAPSTIILTGKDALMGTLAYVFDEKYEDLMPTLNPEKGAIETLAYINHELYVRLSLACPSTC